MKIRNNDKIFLLSVIFLVGSAGLSIVMGIEYYLSNMEENEYLEVVEIIEDKNDIEHVVDESMEEIEDSNTVQVDKIMINIPSEIYISSKDFTGRPEINNAENHMYALQLELTLDETGESLYQSPMLYPNEAIDIITLTTPMEVGAYAVKAVFTAYTMDTEEEVTTVVLDVLLHIVNTI